MSENNSELDSTERKLIGLLSSRQGEIKAVSMKKLAAELKMSSRLLRGYINHLIMEHRIPIMCSTRRKASGYYWCNSQAELKSFNETFKKRAVTSLLKAASMNRQTVVEVAGDLLLEYLKKNTRETDNALKIPGLDKVVYRFLNIMNQQPQLYKNELGSLKTLLECPH
ncbi:MAG: hypothetical protein ACE5GM_05005 [bacterium]